MLNNVSVHESMPILEKYLSRMLAYTNRYNVMTGRNTGRLQIQINHKETTMSLRNTILWPLLS